jgi:hypothetical protein
MSEREDLGDRLAAANGIRDPAESAQRAGAIREFVTQERRFVRRLGWIALGSWALTMLVPVAAILGLLARIEVIESGGEVSAGYGLNIAMTMFGVLGALALVAAIVFTVAWLLRSRSTGLALIEMRLAELEALLEREGTVS